MTWTITIGGSVYPVTFEKVEQELNNLEKAYFTIDNTPAYMALLDSEPSCIVSFLGVPIFRGTVGTWQVVSDRMIRVEVYDSVYYKMSKRIHPSATTSVVYNAEQCDTILAAVVAEVAGINVGICPSDAISVKFNRANCFDIAQFLASAVNKDFYSTSGDTINIGDRGSERGRLVILGEPSRRKVSNFKNRTKVIVRGVDADGHEIEGSAGAGDDVVAFTEKKANDTTTLDNIAAQKLEEIGASSNGVKLQSPIEYSYNLNPGDTVTINNTNYGLAGSYKIWRITKNPDTADIEIDRAEALLEKYLDEQRNMEDYGIFSSPDAILDNPVGNPADVSGVTATAKIQAIEIVWNDVTDADLDEYIIYRDESASATTELARIRSNSYVDKDVVYGTDYYYRVKAVDRVGNLSTNYSNEDSATPDRIVEGDISDGAVTAVKGVLALRDWSHSLTFSATDKDTIAWTSGSLYLSSGNYAIDAGNTGNMAALTYIYFDADVSTTVLQISTDVADVVGNNKLLIGAAVNVADATKKAKFQIFGGMGWGGTFVVADNIASNVITANELVANFVISNMFMTNANVVWAEGSGTAGIIITDHVDAAGQGGIKGKDSSGNYQFYLDSYDGKAYFLAGQAWLDENGLSIVANDGVALEGIKFLDNDAVTPIGDLSIRFDDSILLSSESDLYLTALNGDITLQATADINLNPSGDVNIDGDAYAVNIYGITHLGDIYLSDLICPKCGKPFIKTDDLALTIKEIKENKGLKEMICVPCHRHCNPINRMLYWIHGRFH